MEIKAQAYKDAMEDLEHLSRLMDDMISDMHNVKGGQQVRHCYMLYRDRIYDVQRTLREGTKNE